MFKKCKRGMTVLLAAVMLLTTMLPLTASAASGVTMDLTDCHVSWDYTLTDEEGNTFTVLNITWSYFNTYWDTTHLCFRELPAW